MALPELCPNQRQCCGGIQHARSGNIYPNCGKTVRTVSDLTAAIRAGVVKVQDIPVEYVVRPNGNVLIHNTRTAEALRRAGIPRSHWNAVDCSDDAEVVKRVHGQLDRNNLDDNGVPQLQ